MVVVTACRTMALVHEYGIRCTPVFDASFYVGLAGQRMDSGRAHAVMRLRTAQAMAASVCWAGKECARRRRPINPLYRPMAVSIRARLP